MPDLSTVTEWLREHSDVVWIVGVSSLLLALVGIALVPFAVLRLPVDLLERDPKAKGRTRTLHPVLWWLGVTVKNLLGALLMALGLALLFLPGQGVLTFLVGFSLLSFPGKRRLLRAVLRQSAVLEAINRIRRRAGKEPLRPGPEKPAGRRSRSAGARPRRDDGAAERR